MPGAPQPALSLPKGLVFEMWESSTSYRALQLPAGGVNVAAARRSARPREAIQAQPETAYGTVTSIDAVTDTLVLMSVAVIV